MDDKDKEKIGEHDVKIAQLTKDVHSLEHRMEKQDVINETIQKMTTSIEVMAQNMQQLIKECAETKAETRKNGEEIQSLKLVPAKKWSAATTAILTGAIGVVVGLIVNALVGLIG